MADTASHPLLGTAAEIIAASLRGDERTRIAIGMLLAGDVSRFDAIRRFFLDPSETYSTAELAALWQIPAAAVEALFEEEIATWKEQHSAAQPFRVRWADAVGMAIALTIYRPLEIELALGEDFSCARPEHWRVRPLLIALPQWTLDTIASESTLPATLSIEARVEQLLLMILRGHGAGTSR